MAYRTTTADNDDNEEIEYHDQEKQEQVIAALQNEIKQIENERGRVTNEFKKF
jgi:hypothetical protein